MYLLFAGGALALAWQNPAWAGYLIYGAILVSFTVATFVIFRDGLFFHLESSRLEQDGDIINQRHSGEDEEGAEKEKEKKPYRGLLGRKRTVFRSKLLQIHYQNILPRSSPARGAPGSTRTPRSRRSRRCCPNAG
jgi:hypothetical protein